MQQHGNRQGLGRTEPCMRCNDESLARSPTCHEWQLVPYISPSQSSSRDLYCPCSVM
uniref:Uncharacterized protein n=1 Tax=Arundo donax TaxID=35708 RepID=A0A0A9H4X5_ARUDO